MNADTVGSRAAIRGILNHDYLNTKGSKVFERQPAPEGMKRSGAYRLHVQTTDVQTIETSVEGIAA